MTDISIRVHKLGKRYRLGEREPYRALRDVLAEAVAAPFRRLRSPKSGARSSSSQNIWALEDVSFEVKRGEVMGVIGRNGAGKSTLLKVLSRITEPTQGHAEIHGRVGSLLEVGTGFHPELTGRENVYLNGAILGMRRAEIARQFDEIVAFAEIDTFLDTPVKRYSSGMLVRLAFAVAAHLEPEILLVDEVLAVGDAAFQKKCLGKMDDVARQGRTVLFVSHNMGAVLNLCRRGLVLDRGHVGFQGSAQEAVQFYNHSVASAEGQGRDYPGHVIYAAPSADPARDDFAVVRIEVVDLKGRPKPVVATWEDVVLRMWYRCSRFVQRGSVVLELMAFDGSRLLLLSTQPDGTLPLPLEVGEHCVECVIERLPLASGEYIIGAGIAIPNAEWLWRRRELGRMVVVPHDVYGSGLAPVASRALVAPQHHWRIVS